MTHDDQIHDIYIAVMGVTGAGKSTFISTCSQKKVKIGHTLQSCTADVEDVAFMYNRTLRVHLIDTPGFDDSERSDVQVLQDIAHWLSKSFKAGTRLSGVIFIHRISDLRMTGSIRRNLLMFKKLCGEQAYQSVVLATSMWSRVTLEEGERREGALIETDEYWGLMCKKGSKVFRYAGTRESALGLIGYIVSLHMKVTLDIQDEMVNKGHDIDETSAAHELNAAIIRERKKHSAELEVLREHMQEAIKEHDKDLQNQIKENIDTIQYEISKGAEEQQKLRQTLQEVDKRKEEEFRAFVEQMKNQREQERQRYDSKRREYLASIARQEEASKHQQRRERERMEVDKAGHDRIARKQEEYRRAVELQRKADERRLAMIEENHYEAKDEWEEQVRRRKNRSFWDSVGNLLDELFESVSSQSSLQDEPEAIRELVTLIIDSTQLPTLYPRFRQNFELSTFKSKIHRLLKAFSKDLSSEASIPNEKKIARFVSLQRKRVAHAIGQEVFALTDQSVFDSISHRKQLSYNEKTEKYLRDSMAPKGGDEWQRQQEQVIGDESSGDKVDFESIPNLEHVKKFLITSNAFGKLRIGIKLLAQAEMEESPMPDEVLASTDETFSLPNMAHSHPDQKELENKAEKEGLLSEILGTLSSSSPAEPVEPLIISPPRKSHLLTMPQRLYWRALWFLRPRVKVGYRRLEWICDCGTPLYGDFKGVLKEIDKLGMDLQASGFVIPKQSTSRAQAVPVSSGQQHTTSSSVAQAFLKSNAPQAAPASSANPTASSVAGGIVNPTPEVIVAAPAMSMPFAGIPKYLALCVNINKFKKTLSEIHMSSINEDIPTFRKFKEKYEECRGSRAKALRGWLIKPVDIKFIQFAVERSQRVYAILEPPDCTLCAHKNNQDTLIKSRQYEPHCYTTALVHPPIPSDAFFHLWECPEEVPETQAKWINRLPKKLHESLEEVRRKQEPGDDTLIHGWGILIVEGLNKLAVSLLTLLVIVLSGAVSICYTVWARDTSGGFAIGAYIVAVLVALTTALYYQWEKG